MPARNLDARTVDAAKPREATYRLSDGGGLLLEVRPSGARAWLCRVTVDGKRRDIGLGGYPLVTLKEAREKALAVRKQAYDGLDPVAERDRVKREREAARKAAAEAKARTFRNVALACIEARSPGWKNKRTGQIWRATFERYVFPVMGDTPIAEVDRAAVLSAVSPIWERLPGIAPRLLQRIQAVLRYAVARDWRANEILLPEGDLQAPPSERGHPSLAWARLPAFWQALDKVEGLGAAALRVVILTALRSGEVRQARWSWLSFDGTPTLTVPDEMMKGRKRGRKKDRVQPHRVPLTPAALEALARAYGEANGTTATVAELPRLAALARDALIFPSAKRTTPISDMTLSAAVRRMNAARAEGHPAPWRDPADGRAAVPHGFRATFSTWVDDTRPHEREVAEKALAHVLGNRVSAAYRHSDLFDRRVSLMAEWSAHVLSGATAAEGKRGRKAG
jgi:integrase